jgi:hypothetical protein
MRIGPGHRYSVYGVGIESGFCLSSLDVMPADLVHEPITFERVDERHFAGLRDALPSGSDDWLHHAVLSDGSVYIRDDDVFETVISAGGRRITCARLGDADDRSFEASLLNFALGAALTLQGEEPLHATVVDLAGRAVGLLGTSGAGKSTLAAFLIGQGADLVTDDMLRITFDGDQAVAHPGPYRLKLFSEAAHRLLPAAAEHGHLSATSGKVLVEPRRAHRADLAPRPLVGLFSLADAEEDAQGPMARRLGGAALLRTLVSSAMDIRYDTSRRLARLLRFAERLGHALPVHELCYRRDYADLGWVADEIRRTVEA